MVAMAAPQRSGRDGTDRSRELAAEAIEHRFLEAVEAVAIAPGTTDFFNAANRARHSGRVNADSLDALTCSLVPRCGFAPDGGGYAEALLSVALLGTERPRRLQVPRGVWHATPIPAGVGPEELCEWTRATRPTGEGTLEGQPTTAVAVSSA